MSTFYISPSGNDSTGNGSESTPWATLAKFLSSSSSGDTCICKDGTYTWATATITNRTIQAENNNLAIFDGSGAGVKITLSGTVNFTGLVFQNAVATGTRVPFFDILNVGIATCTRCIFRDLILITSGTDGGVFAKSNFTQANALVFTLCVFYRITSSAGLNGNILSLRGNGSSLILTGCVFRLLETVYNPGCIIGGYASESSSNVAQVTIKNCIFSNETGATVSLQNTTGTTISTTMTYSLTYNITSVPAGTGNITGNPLFVDAANGNFNLRPTSPAINAGTLL